MLWVTVPQREQEEIKLQFRDCVPSYCGITIYFTYLGSCWSTTFCKYKQYTLDTEYR